MILRINLCSLSRTEIQKNAITNISVDDHTITIDKAITFLKQGDIEEISPDELNELLAIFSTSSEQLN